jgi:hypothetical protein
MLRTDVRNVEPRSEPIQSTRVLACLVLALGEGCPAPAANRLAYKHWIADATMGRPPFSYFGSLRGLWLQDK